MNTRKTIIRLLSGMASAKEITQYLKRFSQLDAKRFALVKVGGAVLRDDLEELTSSLHFLQQVGLTPIVVHGAGPQLDAELAAAGIGNRSVDGLRYTPAPVLAIVRRVMQAQNLRLMQPAQAVPAPRPSPRVPARLLDRARYGPGARWKASARRPIEAALADRLDAGHRHLGESGAGQISTSMPMSPPMPAGPAALQDRLPHRHRRPARWPGPGDRLDQPAQRIRPAQPPALAQRGMKLKIEQIRQLAGRPAPAPRYRSPGRRSWPTNCSPPRLGTRSAPRRKVLRATRWDELDLERLRALIQSGFGRPLAADYFQRTPLLRAYVSEHYRAALILVAAAGGVYMDKFAVLDEAQGEGLGRALWNRMRAEVPALFWRSRHGNPVNEFYQAQADGSVKLPDWQVFWIGLPGFDGWRTCRALPPAPGQPDRGGRGRNADHDARHHRRHGHGCCRQHRRDGRWHHDAPRPQPHRHRRCPRPYRRRADRPVAGHPHRS